VCQLKRASTIAIRPTDRQRIQDELSALATSARRTWLARSLLSGSQMFIRKIILMTSLWFGGSSGSECTAFQRLAAAIEATPHQYALLGQMALLASYPAGGCAPAERYVLAKRLLEHAPSPALSRLVLIQGLREHRSGARRRPNVVAQVELLWLIDPSEARCELRQRAWEAENLEAVLEEYAERAEALLARIEGAVVPSAAERARAHARARK
jgi:hypothetical protein